MEPYALIVDDNPSDTLLITSLVNQEGFLSTSAQNGHDALECLFDEESKIAYSIVIVDLHMPFMGGFELIRRIRQSERYKKIPILVSSGRSDSADVQKALSLGANDYLVKPLDPQLFQEKFNALKGTNIKWTEYAPIPNSKYANIQIARSFTLTGLSEVGATIQTDQPLIEGEVVVINGDLFNVHSCPPLTAKVKSIIKREDSFICQTVFLGTTKEVQKKLRLMCRALWTEEPEEEKSEGPTEETLKEAM